MLFLLATFGGDAAFGNEVTLYAFRGGTDGESPRGALVMDGAGDLIGTAENGGDAACNGGRGCGVVFKLGPHRDETVLYSFGGGVDGQQPVGGLIEDSDGNFYGTTAGGGSTACGAEGGCGTVFKLAPDGTKSVLYAFQGGSDGWQPQESLVADADGDLYGATPYGGSFEGADCEQFGCGTVYEIEPDGTKLTLYEFQGGSDGSGPFGGVILDSAGNVYGTTGEGGGSCGCGTVFKIALGGTETLLYAFHGGADGAGPVGLTMDGAGYLYGATVGGGKCKFENGGCGTVYRLAPDGSKSVLYDFQAGDDGFEPSNTLTLDEKGDLYGNTLYTEHGCKKDGCGAVFEVSPAGKETTLHTFKEISGAHPFAPLLLGAHDELYGTTIGGGKAGHGVVFAIKK